MSEYTRRGFGPRDVRPLTGPRTLAAPVDSSAEAATSGTLPRGGGRVSVGPSVCAVADRGVVPVAEVVSVGALPCDTGTPTRRGLGSRTGVVDGTRSRWLDPREREVSYVLKGELKES